jgi:XrtN system VIT domain protein
MPLSAKFQQDTIFLIGLILLIISALVGVLPASLTDRPADGLFIFNFGLAFIYMLTLLLTGRLKKGRNGLPPLFLFLVMFLISAFVLNRDIQIFHVSTPWLNVLLVVCSINYVLVFWYDAMPRWLKLAHVFIMSVSLLLFSYLSLYLFPQYTFSAVFFWVLLLPLHSFVPLLFVIYTIFWLLKVSEKNRAITILIWSSISLVMVFIIGFVISWKMEVNRINSNYKNAESDAGKSLPAWVRAAAKTPANWMTERILKTDSRFGSSGIPVPGRDWFWNLPEIRRSNDFRHDPLISIATFFDGNLSIPVEERVLMLQAVFNERHQSEERLWSGDDLYTEEVNTMIRIWPQYRISYTDMTVKVRCGYDDARWTREQEAIYSFYLPEGSAVTALSLWIDGVESPGILTTRQKADSAYTTIVGREMRDPSVLHWQEGNRVSVRVFPVVAGQYRKFRVGVSTPLQMKRGRLEYQSIGMEGPLYTLAAQPVLVEMMGTANDLQLPSGFDPLKKNSFERKGRFKTDWSISMAATQTVATNAFHFKGHTYNVKEYAHQRSFFQPDHIYLDLNKSWTREEFDMALRLPGQHKTFVCQDEKLVEITARNKEALFKALHQQQFSLFPVHQVTNPNNALLISKSKGRSPNLADLKATKFLDSLKSFASAGSRIRLFCIDGEISPYLRTLKEYRLFHYEQGTLDDCSLLMARKEFSMDIENDNQVVLDHSRMTITRSQDSTASSAPDHLMRLFVYNHVMQQAGKGMLNGATTADALVAEAAAAHVVTPVSSLVVLESQKDYDRFEIKDTQDGLKNAALSSNGAVPEPHEWALIILSVFVLFILKFRPVWKRRWS